MRARAIVAGKLVASERDVQSAVLTFLRYHPDVAWAARTNTGQATFTDGHGTRKVRFGMPGWPDITGQMVDGRFLALEAKSSRGKVTFAQQTFLKTVRRFGGVAGVVRSIDDAKDTVEGRRCAMT